MGNLLRGMSLKVRYSWTNSILRSFKEKDFEKILNLPNVRESPFYEKLKGFKVKCTLCNRECKLDHCQVGVCGVRFNYMGKLYTTTYGLLTAAESRPMEIKPFFHFYPRTSAMTISTWGCTFPCAWCQNWSISKKLILHGDYVSPEKLIQWTLDVGDSGINVSLNEPTLLTEYAIDVFKLAKKYNLHLSYNTNGYLSRLAIEKLKEVGLEGMNIDLKGFKETYRKWLLADFDKYWSSVVYAKKLGIHIELTYLVIPGVNDYEVINALEKVIKDLGSETPIHLTKFHPDHKLLDADYTPVELLEKLYNEAKKLGFQYVYIGNVPGHPYEHTYCPNCGKIVIKRYGMYVIRVDLIKDEEGYKCPNCRYRINIHGYIGEYGRLFKWFI